MHHFTPREEIIETVNKLFIYTDYMEWKKLQTEVFTEKLMFDMTSMGGDKLDTTSAAVCNMWKDGFEGIDAVNHLGGNYLVTINNETARAFAYATATHFKQAAKNGNIREFAGSYDLGLVKTVNGWRINSFTYNLKYVAGNAELT